MSLQGKQPCGSNVFSISFLSQENSQLLVKEIKKDKILYLVSNHWKEKLKAMESMEFRTVASINIHMDPKGEFQSILISVILLIELNDDLIT